MGPTFLLAAVIAATTPQTPSPSPSPTGSPLPTIGTVRIVTGSAESLHRAPQPASVLDGRALRTSTAPAIDAALRVLPGVDRDRSNAPFTNYGQLRLSFSGAGTDRGTLFVDGVPAQDGFGGQVNWNIYPVGSVDRAELLRGPGSALYGSGAIGGALSLFTRIAPPREGVFDASAGGIDRGSASLIMGVPTGPTSTTLTLATRRLAYDVIPAGQNSVVDRTAISTADVAHVVTRFNAREGGEWRLDALSADDAQQDGRPNDGFARSQRQLALSWLRGGRESIAVNAYARATTITNLADRYPTLPGALLYTQHVPTSDAGVRVRWDVPLDAGGTGSDALAFVVEHRMVSGRSDQISFAGLLQSDVSGTQRLDGVAVQRAWQGRLGGVVGARYDRVATNALGERIAGALSPRVALRYDASPATAVRAAFGTGLRAPYLNELIRSFRIGNVLQQNNPLLVPERSRSLQFGFDVAGREGRLAADYTGTRVQNAIGFQTISAIVQQRANLGRTATDAYTAEYERGSLCTRFRAFGTLNHDRVVVGSPAQIGKRLAYVPDSAASLGVERTVRALTGALEVSYSGPTFSDDLERQPLGTALLVGGRLTLRSASGAAISLALDNLADTRYLTSVDRQGPPSSLTLRLSLPVGARASGSVRPWVCG
jgi:outer membrane receptor protein involved in Fe transport